MKIDLAARLGAPTASPQPGHLPVTRRLIGSVSTPARAISDWLTRLLTQRGRVPSHDRLHRLVEQAGTSGTDGSSDPARLVAHMVIGASLGVISSVLLIAVLGHNSTSLPLSMSLRTHIMVAVVVAIVGAVIPLIRLIRRGQARSRAIAAHLPDALDLLALATAAGLSLDAAVARVAVALRGPLAEELHRWSSEVGLGASRSRAIRDLADRSGLPELRAFAAAIAQAEAAGTPIADVLRSQAAVQRDHRSLRAEERAQRLPVTLVVPLVLCVLPSLFVVVIGPAVLSILTGQALP